MDEPVPPSPDVTRSLDLVRRAQKGEDEALNDLIDRYYERVRKIVRVRLGKPLRNYVESGDILQETFAAAVTAFNRFEMREESSLIHWLSKIAENQIKAAADYHNAQKRDRRKDKPLRGPEDSRSGVFEPAADVKLPLEELQQEEELEDIDHCLEQMREEYREVILHRDYMRAPWETVAERLGSPSPDAARMLYARAITELSTRVHSRRRSSS